ncbi:MAG: hypothetical protein NVS2B3_19160 [Vulcanimicrobiaceae bacterium]
MSFARRVWFASAAYALVYFALGAIRYAAYRSGSDLGLFTQSIAAAGAGFVNTTEGGSHFTFHFSPILYACAPLLIATHSPLALVAIQAAAGALVAPPLYAIARSRVPEGLAASIACVALLYPPLAGVTFADFHENGFAPAATMWLLWAVDARRLRVAALALLVVLAVKEDQAAIVCAVGVVAALGFARAGDGARARFAASAALVSAGTFVAFFGLVRTVAGAHDAWAPSHFYAWSGDARGSAPWYSIGRPAYLLEAFLPLAFVALASPAIVLAIPGFVEVLGSHESITYTMGQHYAAVWIAYVLFAFALAIGSLHARAPRRATTLVRASLALCAIVLAVASPTHWSHYVRARTAHDAARDRALARLPQESEVGAADDLYAHLGFDPRARLGFAGMPQYALVDATADGAALDIAGRPSVLASARAGRYRRVWSDDGLELYERVGRRP